MLRILIFLNILLTFLLISLGGFVHNTGSSLACPDWPLCYGQVMPVMEGSVLIEHSHRLLASLVGFLTILMVFISKKSKSVIFGPSIFALLLVIFQGVLGGLTVLFKLPTIVSTAHLATSMLFFMTLIYIDHKGYFHLRRSVGNVGNLQNIAKFSLILLYLQMILGAFIRHSGLGGVCGVGYDSILVCQDVVDSIVSFIPSSVEAQYHMMHRYLGALLGLVLVIFPFFLKRVSALLASFIFLMVILQVSLGVMTVGTNLEVYTTTLHLTGASLLFGLLWKALLILKSNRLIQQDSHPSFLEDMIDLTKPRLSSLVIFTATIGLILAPGEISFFKAFFGILGITGIVAGSCVLNCYIERDVDRYMLRTASRPLPKKRLDAHFARNYGIFLIVFFTPVIYFSSNLLTTILGLIAALIYIFLYTPLKRKSSWSVFVGAIPGAIPPLMGWTMVTNHIDPMGMILFGILFFWQFPHFLAIATFRVDEYKKAGLVVTPIVSGLRNTVVKIAFSTVLLVAVSLIPVKLFSESQFYFIFTLLIGSLFLVFAIYGLFIKDELRIKAWARKYFWGSIIYLPVLLLGLVFLL